MKEEILKVKGMTCDNCKHHVEEALKELEGVTSATVDLAKKNVTVLYDDVKLQKDKIVSAITEAGYQVKKGLFS